MSMTSVNTENIQAQKCSFTIIPARIIMGMLLAVLMILGSCQSPVQNKSSNNGFLKIFDGKTLNGWEGDPTYWRVENGSLVGEIKPATLLERNQFIIWRGGVTNDFELTLDFKITKDGNSGINYRSEELKDLKYALRGYQADIDGANRYTGQNYEERGRTTLAYRGEEIIVKEQNTPGQLEDHISNNAWTERIVTGSLGSSDSLKALIKSRIGIKCIWL